MFIDIVPFYFYHFRHMPYILYIVLPKKTVSKIIYLIFETAPFLLIFYSVLRL